MNELKLFENEDFGLVRIVVVNGEPWFVGKDVAMALGYAKPENAVSMHVDEEDKTSTLIQGSGSNYKSKAIVINESGVYALVFGSKMPNARLFKRWVTSEVLPSIRKTGGYVKQDSYMIADPVERANRWIEEELERQKLAEKVALDAPKVDFFDAVASSESLMSFEQVAKLIAKKGLGRNKLIHWLRDLRILRKTKNGNVPYQEYVNRGLFKLVESRKVIDGTVKVFATTFVTQKGLDYILDLSKFYEKE